MRLLGIAGAAIAAAAAATIGWLARPLAPDPQRRAELADAVSAVDRELAANLELMSMFDQTRTAVVLEIGEFVRHRVTLEREAAVPAGVVEGVYARIPETESAMERRGPSQTIREEDRRVIEAWEGDARAAQRALREARDARPRVGWAALSARLRGRLTWR